MSLFRLKGVRTPHRKNTAQMPAVRMPAPQEVVIPMSMHIGAPATPLVKAGDTVCVGDVIAEAGGFVSAPVHASVSGTVKSIGEFLLTSGKKVPCITVVSDGMMTVSDCVKPPEVVDRESFLNAVRASGSVGLGGAGFPTFVKLNVKDPAQVDTVVINGAECEPYITSDTRTMLDRAEEIEEGIRLLQTYLGIGQFVIGIERNKPECIAKMQELAARNTAVKVVSLPSVYPQGAEKVLIYHTTGRTVPAGKLPLDVGVIVMNCTTVAFLAQYVRTGMPLVEKCITVDGSAVKCPQNIIAPVGTALKDVFAFCGGFREQPAKVLYGGPMMGIAVVSLDAPVIKNTNAVLALDEQEAKTPSPTACIRCGACVNHCPMRLDPAGLSRALEREDAAALIKGRVDLCMECGCCSYICPASRPLIQQNRLAKEYLRKKKAREEAREKQKAEAAKAQPQVQQEEGKQ